ncbi:MAG TPA: ribosome maturation factor RimM [Thermoanaerobaculia bacterium]|jgi:16S rRNA processing protein RimM|nr:ribosome maturation factor RimM [Thermoanaerobaculia bacterium]
MPPLLIVGLVRRLHGLAGEVSVEVVTDFPGRFVPGAALVWRAGAAEKTVTVCSVRPHAKRLLLGFAGFETVDAARTLCGGELCVAETDAQPAPEGFYYAHEVRGFACEDASGRLLGTATGLEATPAGSMLTVDAEGREVLVPWTHPIVVRVERLERRIVLDPPDGLFDL